MTEAERERAAVVAWLRKQAAHCEREQSDFKPWEPVALCLQEQIETFHVAADAIEAGEHLKEGE